MMQFNELCRLENGDILVQNETKEYYIVHPIKQLNVPSHEVPQFLELNPQISPEKLRLIALGIPQDLLGFKYIYEALAMIKQDPTYANKSTVLFRAIGRKYKVSYSSVDRTVRYALQHCNPDSSLFKEIFGEYKMVTIKHFIVALSQYTY